VWNNGSTLRYSVFNGSTWSAAQTISAYTGAEPERLQIAAQPRGDGMALTVSSAVVSGKVTDYALIWNGNSWGNAITLDSTGENIEDQLTTAVAYESVSGRAMVAFTKYSTSNYGNIDYNVYYQIFNGSTWSSAAKAGNYTDTAVPYTLTLASDPHSNRIAFGLVGAGFTAGFNYQVINSFAVWDGSAWGARHTYSFVVGDTSAMGPSVAVGFESISGDALAVYGTASNTLRYATWSPTTSTWTAGASTVPLSAVGQTVRLYADPVSNHLVAGVNSTDGALTFIDWSGSAWATPTTVASQTGASSSSAFSWFWQNPRLDATPNDLWLGSAQDTTGWSGVNTVSDTEVLSFEGTNPQYGASTSGTFSHLFDMGAFGASGLDDIVWVTREVQLNSWMTLQRGDVLFSVSNDSTLVSANTTTVSRNDVVLFRPDSPGDYSRGTFSVLIQGLGDGSDIKGLALVEQSVQMGDVTLQTGEILFSMGTGSTGADIYRFTPSVLDLGTGLLSGLYTTLITGSEIGINQVIQGLEVITSVTTLSNITLPSGSLLMSFEQAGGVGTVPVAVAATEVVLVTPTLTSAGGSTAQASAEVIFKGSSVGLNSGSIDTLALSRQTPPSIVQPGTGTTSAITVNENQTAVTTVQATDPDANTSLSYRIAGGADGGLFMMNSSTGQLTFASAPDREQPMDAGGDNVYEVIVAASDGDLEDFQTLNVTVNNVDESPLITSDGGGATASLQVAEAQTLATTVQAVDPEGAALSYAITGGADAALFSIDATTGQLTFLQAPDAAAPQDSGADNIYELTVSASVGADTDSQQLQIQVLALNRPPVNALPANLSLLEDSIIRLSGIQVSDTDAGSAPIQVRFSVLHGTLSILSTVPGGLSSTDLLYSTDERQVTLTGTLAQINATLGAS
ncbi:MAG TPA: cadherin domain-containing protein, partial [Aquabacterium sp.]|nr:cadherin domain-containing protein [Aquabacterium sp.]